MKKLLLIALVALPITSEAVCFKTFYASGYGINMKTAVEDLESNASNTCGGVSDYNWIQKMSEVTYSDAEENASRPIKATALYKCCTQW